MAYKTGIINKKNNDREKCYSPSNLQEGKLTDNILYELVGGRSARIGQFIETGSIKLPVSGAHANKCIFCDSEDFDWDHGEEIVLTENTLPQYSDTVVRPFIKICDKCLVDIYFSRDITELNNIDCCKSCKNYYLVDPDEFERRMSDEGEGRGMNTCDGCLIEAGLLGESYIQHSTCAKCSKDKEYSISLTEMIEYEFLCSSCEDERQEEIYAGRLDELEEEEARRAHDEIKKARERSDKDYGYIKLDISSLGHGYGQPENLFAQVYKIPVKGENHITFDLVEIDPEKLEKITNFRQIMPDMITWSPVQYSPYAEDGHDDYFTFSINGFMYLKKVAEELADKFIKSIETLH